MNNNYHVYILKCSDDSTYVGYTTRIAGRIKEHQRGEVHYTKDKLPITLITFISFSEKQKAYDFERYLKSGSGRAFMYKRLV